MAKSAAVRKSTPGRSECTAAGVGRSARRNRQARAAALPALSRPMVGPRCAETAAQREERECATRKGSLSESVFAPNAGPAFVMRPPLHVARRIRVAFAVRSCRHRDGVTCPPSDPHSSLAIQASIKAHFGRNVKMVFKWQPWSSVATFLIIFASDSGTESAAEPDQGIHSPGVRLGERRQ
jgi:hypothetical protein